MVDAAWFNLARNLLFDFCDSELDEPSQLAHLLLKEFDTVVELGHMLQLCLRVLYVLDAVVLLAHLDFER